MLAQLRNSPLEPENLRPNAGQERIPGDRQLKGLGTLGRLHEMNTRALTIGAKYDEMEPEDMKKMATPMPNASSFICQQGSHLFCMWDDQAF